jgi:membrane protease YdiL (CAAX protease family)
LGLLNFIVVITAVSAAQLAMQKYIGPVGAAGAAILALLGVGVYIVGCRWIERRAPTDLGIQRAPIELTAGMVLGLVLFSCVMLVLRIGGVYHPAGRGSYQQLGSGFLLAVMAGFLEEILFRGLLFRACSKLAGTWGALLLTSALFGAAHAANRGATVSSSLAIALEAGILLGAAYAATGRLWVPIGLHIGWNFTEGSVYGMTLSGNAMGEGLIRGSLSGPRILTGGEFGPEASVVAVIVCLAAAAYFLGRIVKSHRVESPIWRKAPPPVMPAEAPV